MRKLFVTGIGTDVGKTIVSAILTEALQADYWKPVQCGVDVVTGKTDRITVKDLISNNRTVIHPEAYFLKLPASPHAAAKQEGVNIDFTKINLPETPNDIVIEGAGGIMVPLNEKELVIDLIEKLKAEVVIVSRNYLGSINHTLLTCAELKRRNIPVFGIVFNGEENEETENIILKYSGFKKLLHVKKENSFTSEMIKQYASVFSSQFSILNS